jgi:hypothetical protein
MNNAQLSLLKDVFLLGPSLIYLATKKGELDKGSRYLIFTMGLTAIVYGMHRYVEAERSKWAEARAKGIAPLAKPVATAAIATQEK